MAIGRILPAAAGLELPVVLSKKEWSAKLSELKAKTNDLSQETKEKINPMISQLQEKINQGKENLAQLRQQSQENWQQTKAKLEGISEGIKNAIG